MDTALLGHGPEWWNVAMLVMLGIVVLSLCLLAVTAAGVILVQRRDAANQSRVLDEYKSEATQKIAEARALAAQAVERAAAANERATLIEKQSHELHGRNLALEQELKNVATPAPHAEPGVPSREAFLSAVKAAGGGRADISYVHACAECRWLAEWMEGALKEAGWSVKGAGLAADAAAAEKAEHDALPAGAHSWKVTILARFPLRKGQVKSKRSAEVLVEGLAAALGQAVETDVVKDEILAEEHVKIEVAPRG